MSLKPGDVLSLSRDAKVFVTQYHSIGGFVSLSRRLGDDPEADVADMQVTLDQMWHEALLNNHRVANGAYEAMGKDGDITALLEYLEGVRRGESQEAVHGEAPEVQSPAAPRKRQLKRRT